jgi:ribonuclease-3
MAEVKAKKSVKKSPLDVLQKKIGYRFKRKDLLESALTHRSLQQRGEKKDYERLEYLGDAVLDLAIAHLLLDEYPEHKEGDLSKMRAALVNTQNLASIAHSLELSAFVRVSKSEESTGGKERPSLLADVVEALFGAIYRDGGYNEAKDVIDTIFYDLIKKVSPTDPKTELQEVLHALAMDAPIYRLDTVAGPEHAPSFISSVLINDKVFGTGKGATKKSSQAEAASMALAHLKKMSAKKEK